MKITSDSKRWGKYRTHCGLCGFTFASEVESRTSSAANNHRCRTVETVRTIQEAFWARERIRNNVEVG